MFENQIDIINESVDLSGFIYGNSTLSIKREDRLHPHVSGNKFRKLKYNIQEAQQKGFNCLLTFGGAYSNHISAVAVAGRQYGFKTIGIIRGDELQGTIGNNDTLMFAKAQGMQLYFVTREEYRLNTEEKFLEKLDHKFGPFYLLPEGGTNRLAIKGCEEILTDRDSDFDYICSAVGTGGTMAGLINASWPHQKIVGFSVLKGVFQHEIIKRFSSKTNYDLTDDFSFGGYAKIDTNLIRFINEFKKETKIPLDPVYTGKMMFGIFDLLKKGYFKENCRILAVHTGGLQGISGMNQLLKKKKLPQIDL